VIDESDRQYEKHFDTKAKGGWTQKFGTAEDQD
jgi:hypothetical protein